MGPLIVQRVRRYGPESTFSRIGWIKSMASKSYWSYGKVNHKDRGPIPEGRVLIDTAKSFVYTEGGLKGDRAGSGGYPGTASRGQNSVSTRRKRRLKPRPPQVEPISLSIEPIEGDLPEVQSDRPEAVNA
ncbi:MAG: hypothetical protein ABR985_19720 [Methanotrichaceae archaeon]|jgi:hypothetical protein